MPAPGKLVYAGCSISAVAKPGHGLTGPLSAVQASAVLYVPESVSKERRLLVATA